MKNTVIIIAVRNRKTLGTTFPIILPFMHERILTFTELQGTSTDLLFIPKRTYIGPAFVEKPSCLTLFIKFKNYIRLYMKNSVIMKEKKNPYHNEKRKTCVYISDNIWSRRLLIRNNGEIS